MAPCSFHLGVRRLGARATATVAMILAILLAGCGGGGGGTSPPAAVTVTAQPSSASAVTGGGVTFTVAALGDNLVFQWQRSSNAGVTWVDLAGATAASYVIAAVNLSDNGSQYRALVTSGGTTVTTAAVTVRVAASTLSSRLSGAAFYDPALDATFLADANLPATLPLGVPGIDADGSMSWTRANSWVLALNAANYLGHNDWRLPKVAPINGTAFRYSDGSDSHADVDGTIDLGKNISAPGTTYAAGIAAELPYLYYNELGSISNQTTLGATQDNSFNSNAPLKNVVLAPYWTSQRYSTDGAMAFDFKGGNQNAFVTSTPSAPDSSWHFHVLVLRSGDSSVN